MKVNSLKALRRQKRNSRSKLLFLFAIVVCSNQLQAQTTVDVSMGTGFQDDISAQTAIRNQFSPKLNVGFEFQTGAPKYRFVGTKVMREGYTFALSLPISIQLQKLEKIELYGIGRIGARFQGIIDPDNNDMRDSILSSKAIIGEFGLLTAFMVSGKTSLQSGITFPIAYETSPLSLMEYMHVKLHLGGNHSIGKVTLFVHSDIGAAFGASGDTYKYIWSANLGARFSFGEKKNSQFNFVQPSF